MVLGAPARLETRFRLPLAQLSPGFGGFQLQAKYEMLFWSAHFMYSSI